MKETILNYLKTEISADNSEGLNSDDELFTLGIIDSLGVMKLIGFIEQEYNTDVPFHEITIENFSTVDKIVAYLSKK